MKSLKSRGQNASRLSAFRIKALCTAMVKLSNQDLERRLKKKDIHINLAALMVLRMVRHEALTIQDVSARLIVAPATLIPIIDELEKKSLLHRGKDASDRRKTPLHITAKGADLLTRTAEVSKNSLLVQGVETMGQENQARLIALLESLTTAISGNDRICTTIEENVTRSVMATAGKAGKGP